MRPTYLLVVGRDPAAWLEPVTAMAARTGLELVRSDFPLAVMAGPGCGRIKLGTEGAVVGTLFPRHGPPRPLTSLDEENGDAILRSRGERLLTAFWGGYVAALGTGGLVRLRRDPSGALPCFMASTSWCDLASSDVDLLLLAGATSPELGWGALARHLFGAGLPQSETSLSGITELLPGFSTELPGDPREQHVYWSPWDHVPRQGERLDSPDAERLRRIVRQSVHAWTGRWTRPLLSLSGGLDSSIVAASLPTGACAICLTLHDDDPAGDERAYARLVCDRLGLPLVERRFRVEDVDIGAPLGSHLPRPFGFTHALAYERAHEDVARSISADAFVTGNGGDNVFGHSQSAAPIADRWLHEGFSAGLWSSLRDVSRQTGCSAVRAAAAALRLSRARPNYVWKGDRTFLHPDVLADLSQASLRHPWLAGPTGAFPGKAGHVASLLRVQRSLEPPRSRVAPVINPLLSQPVMEACLAIPSWELRAGGIDRSTARRAFAVDLPEEIIRRRTKGSPDAFAARLIDHFREAIRERLLDGRLAKEGLLDRRQVERELAGGAPDGVLRMRVLELLPVEAWLDSWSARLGGFSGRIQRAAPT